MTLLGAQNSFNLMDWVI